MHIGYWWESQKERGHYEVQDVGGWTILRWILGKRPLGRPRRRWVDNIKMDLREIGWDGMDWIDLAQDRNQWLL
jgi:hypothetical protein